MLLGESDFMSSYACKSPNANVITLHFILLIIILQAVILKLSFSIIFLSVLWTNQCEIAGSYIIHTTTWSFICPFVRQCGTHTDETLRVAMSYIKIRFTDIREMFSNLTSLRVDEWRSSLIASVGKKSLKNWFN